MICGVNSRILTLRRRSGDTNSRDPGRFVLAQIHFSLFPPHLISRVLKKLPVIKLTPIVCGFAALAGTSQALLVPQGIEIPDTGEDGVFGLAFGEKNKPIVTKIQPSDTEQGPLAKRE